MHKAILLAASLCLFPVLASAQNGAVTYTLQKSASPSADELDAYAKIQKAMDSAIQHYNTHTNLRKTLTVQYNTGVATADASFGGNIRFGANRSYMQVGTAMHEIAHTIGIGTTAEYKALIVDGVYTGKQATSVLKEIDGSTAVLKGDAQHFWPYGINFESEVKGLATLMNHCRVVQAIHQDLFQESIAFQGRIRSRSSDLCMVRSGTSLALGSCTDSASLVTIVAMGKTGTSYRLEFGDRVLDAPNQSTTAGLVLGLYGWNGGTNQRLLASGTVAEGNSVRFRMQHSNLALEARGATLVQDLADAASASQEWELAARNTSAIAPPPARPVKRAAGSSVDPLGRHDRNLSGWMDLGGIWR